MTINSTIRSRKKDGDESCWSTKPAPRWTDTRKFFTKGWLGFDLINESQPRAKGCFSMNTNSKATLQLMEQCGCPQNNWTQKIKSHLKRHTPVAGKGCSCPPLFSCVSWAEKRKTRHVQSACRFLGTDAGVTIGLFSFSKTTQEHTRRADAQPELTILWRLTRKFMLSSWRKASAYWSCHTRRRVGRSVRVSIGVKTAQLRPTSAMQVRMIRHSLALLRRCSSREKKDQRV